MEKGPENSTPPPTTIVNADGAAPFVLVCEHASNYLPTRYRGLGLPEHELSRHIAWDIGAAELTRHLATRLDASPFWPSRRVCWSTAIVRSIRRLSFPRSAKFRFPGTETSTTLRDRNASAHGSSRFTRPSRTAWRKEKRVGSLRR
jgi:hypothetical protein